jgi:hypothetical protein
MTIDLKLEALRNGPCPCGSGTASKDCSCGREFALQPADRETVAFHESGHAVLAVIFSFPIDFATVVPFTDEIGRDLLGLVEYKKVGGLEPGGTMSGQRLRDWLLTGLAGSVIEWKRGTSSRGTMSDLDYLEILTVWPEGDRDAVLAVAIAEIEILYEQPRVWRAIERIAELLMTRDRLSGEEIEREVLAIACEEQAVR